MLSEVLEENGVSCFSCGGWWEGEVVLKGGGSL